MVEPVAGLLGVLAISLSQPLLPYALAFAAGAMIYVVFDDIVPEAHSRLVNLVLAIGVDVFYNVSSSYIKCMCNLTKTCTRSTLSPLI